MPRCESCGRVVGLCACPPGPNEMGEGPLRRGYDGVARAARVDARLASATTPTPPPPRPRPLHPAEAHVGLEFRPPDPEDLAPFDEFNRRRAVERAWEAEAAAAVPGGRRHPQDPVRLGRHYWRAGRAEICAGSTRGKTMHDAAAEDAAEAIRRRLRRGEHPDQSDFLRRTPTHVAAAGGCAAAADALLEAGADPNAPDVAGRTPLHHASLANCGGVVGPETHAVFPEVSRRLTETSNERSTYPSRVPSRPPPPPPPRVAASANGRHRAAGRGRRESRREGRRGKDADTPRGASGTLHRRARASRRRRGSRRERREGKATRGRVQSVRLRRDGAHALEVRQMARDT